MINMNVFKGVLLSLALGSMPAGAMEREVKRVKRVNQEKLNQKLIAAAREGNVERVQRFLEDGAEVNAKDTQDTALQKAGCRGHKEVVECLIQAGANLNAIDPYGRTALMRAIDKGHNEVAKCLIQAGADPNVKKNNIGDTALFYAAQKFNEELIELLIRSGADPNSKDCFGSTALMRAARTVIFIQVDGWIEMKRVVLLRQKYICELLVEAMLGYPKHACAAYYSMNNVEGNIFEGIKSLVAERLCAPHYLGYEKTLEEILKIENEQIKDHLLDKYGFAYRACEMRLEQELQRQDEIMRNRRPFPQPPALEFEPDVAERLGIKKDLRSKGNRKN